MNSVANAVDSLLNSLNVITQKEGVVPPTVSDIVDGSRASFPVGFGHAVCYVAPKVALLGYVSRDSSSQIFNLQV